MTPYELNDRYHAFLQRVYEVIGCLPDPDEFDPNKPATATDLRHIQEQLHRVEVDIRKLDEEIERELEAADARIN